jgi:DNA-binding PadR family transcriptional regulator
VRPFVIAGIIIVLLVAPTTPPRTWITLTDSGRAALAEEIAQLKRLISQVESPGVGPD